MMPEIPADKYAAQKLGEEEALPTFAAPSEPAGAQRPADNYHILAKGETLYALGRKYNVSPKKIIEANQFKDPNRLAIGTKVYIP